MKHSSLALLVVAACYDPQLGQRTDGATGVDSVTVDSLIVDSLVGCPLVTGCASHDVLGRCLVLCEFENSQVEAMSYCGGQNACLATVNTAESRELSLIAGGEYLWIGLRLAVTEPDAGEGWSWSCDDSPLTEPYWDSGEPEDGETCTELTPNGGRWWGKDCAEPDWFVCQAR